MRERPILFSGPMVRAILDGKKTQTRRIVKPQPTRTQTDGWWSGPQVWTWQRPDFTELTDARCPYGAPGDRLWVRETWYIDTVDAGGPVPKERGDIDDDAIYYRADGECCEQIPECDHSGSPNGAPWRPSIHMPRWLSRLTLEVVSVRVERLCSISDEDARAEGMVEVPGEWWTADPAAGPSLHARTARDALFMLWAKLHDSVSVAANPWVWVVEFKRVEAPR